MAGKKLEFIARLQSLIALAVMVAAMSLIADNFFTVDNGLNILRQISINLCLSIGMTLVILTAGIDLSVGSVLALCGVIAAGLLRDGFSIPGTEWMVQFNPSGAVIVAIVVGAMLGWVNGTVITRLGVPPFVATLGMLSAARGLTRLWTAGHEIPLEYKLATVGTGTILKVPTPVWIVGVLTIAALMLTLKTRFGRYVYAVGGNERAARLSGLPVGHIKRTTYMLCGALAGIASVILIARLNAAVPVAGFGYELDSIAAVVIGGTSLSGGRGSIFGTVIGCLIIGVLSMSLALLNVEPATQDVVKGVVIIAAVAIDVKIRGRTND
jgi:ribose transport system permease protein